MVRVPVPSVKEGSGLIGGGQRTVRGRPAARRTCHRSTGGLVANTLLQNTADFGFVRLFSNPARNPWPGVETAD